jgi:hypothetical protein
VLVEAAGNSRTYRMWLAIKLSIHMHVHVFSTIRSQPLAHWLTRHTVLLHETDAGKLTGGVFGHSVPSIP